jgi:RimJ/RimL family protein N-acetyltransferase
MDDTNETENMPATSAEVELETGRLRLRRWRSSDLQAFAQLNADPRVMEFFPRTLFEEESHTLAARIQQHFVDRGFGLWAVEVPGQTSFAGFIGLSTPRFESHFTPCTEIGWRLAADYWGQGLATEGAKAVLDFAFRELRLEEVVSFTAKCNVRSVRVMERIGMTSSSAEDFEHPSLPRGDRLSLHVLYRAKRSCALVHR